MIEKSEFEENVNQVIEANNSYYQALRMHDLASMDALWAHDSGVSCIHPGWPGLQGWEQVRQSLAKIFASDSPTLITIDRESVRMHGSFAFVSCRESIITGSADETQFLVIAEATNIFWQRRGKWRLVRHHASLVEFPRGEGGREGADIVQ